MKKKAITQTIMSMTRGIAALVCAAFVFVGCEGLGSDAQIFAPQSSGAAASGGGTAYVTVGKVRASDGGISLSVVPEAVGVEAFSNFKLSMYDAASESHVDLATAATLVELSTQTIEVPAGEQTFFLSATRGGVTFGGSTTATLEDGSSIYLSFTLWPDPNAKGGVFITVNATGLAACASYAFTRGGGGELIPLDGAGQFAKTAAGATATVELSDVAPGTYTLSVLFYGDEAKTVLLNTYRELVRVSAGLTSRAERSIDLNELYEISYKYYLDGAEVTGETQIAEIIASVSGGTLPENFSRRSAIALPELSHDGWEFAGWYPTASINSENKMTEIAGGSTGDKNLCAIFVTSSSVAADIYVASFGNSAGTGTQVDPLDSIAAAMAKIIGAPDRLKDWVIAINGTLEGCQSLDFSGGSATAPSTCAKSITLTGIRAFDADVGKPKDWIDGGSGWDASEIMYYGGVGANETNGGCAALEVTACDVPLTIKNLGIKGGYGQEGGGISFSRSDKLTLGENAYVTQNLSTNGGGGICVDSSTVILDGGTIEQNKAIGCIFGGGGGVYITDDATFTLKSGSVLNNWLDEGAQCGGAGVCVDGGAFNMEGGTVANNVSVYNITGGVYVKGSDQFNMTGGSISGNKAYPAWYDPDASFEGRGVYVDTVDTENDNVPFTIGQDAFIASDNDIYLMYDSTNEILPKIKITSALSGYEAGQKITITPGEHGYVNNMPVLFDDASGALVAECHDLFAVTPQSDPVVEWSVNSSGCLTDGSGSGGSGVNGNFVQKPFSVSATKQVYFSQGNLQYQGSTSTWRFAERQYDVVPKDKLNFTLINSTYEEWIDLFGWGSSGYNGVYPYTRDYSATYGGDTLQNNLHISDMTTGDNANYDWGVYNAISNGGNQPGLWRTLTKDEWLYLINTRNSSLRVCARIKENADSTATLAGVILLPDDWTAPSDVTLAATPTGGYNNNTLTYAEWEKLEAAGAVFLPALGYQAGATEFYSRGDDANNSSAYFEYWSATGESNDSSKYCVQTYNSGYAFESYQTNGADHYIPVRLVQDVN